MPFIHRFGVLWREVGELLGITVNVQALFVGEVQQVGTGRNDPQIFAGQLDPFLIAVGECADGLFADVLDAEEFDNLFHIGAMLDLLVASRSKIDSTLEEPCVLMEVAADHQVVYHCHPLEEGDILE